MKKIPLLYHYLLSGLMLVNLISCTPSYIPNVFNAPLIKSKNEVNIGGYAGTHGLDAQASASIINHLAVMMDYSYANRHNTGLDSNGFRRHNFFESGIGYYYAPENKKIGMEAWTGYGFGNSTGKASTSNIFDNSGATISGRYTRYFIQGDFGYRSKIVETGFAVRGSYVNFSELTNSNLNETYNSLDNWYVEPMGFVRVGVRFIKFSFQVGASLRVTGTSYYPRFTNQPFYCSAGIHVTLNRKWGEELK